MSTPSSVAIREGLDRAGWTYLDLWRASLGIGGAFGVADIEEIATGRRSTSRVEHDVLATAINEHLSALGEHLPIRYWGQLATT